MPRPLRASPPIQFRVPISTFEVIDKKAASTGQTPTDFVRDLVIEAIGVKDTPAEPGRRRARTEPAPPKCRHTRRQVLGGGLAKCSDCGSTRNMRGVWS